MLPACEVPSFALSAVNSVPLHKQHITRVEMTVFCFFVGVPLPAVFFLGRQLGQLCVQTPTQSLLCMCVRVCRVFINGDTTAKQHSPSCVWDAHVSETTAIIINQQTHRSFACVLRVRMVCAHESVLKPKRVCCCVHFPLYLSN